MSGFPLVISETHAGLVDAIGAALLAAVLVTLPHYPTLRGVSAVGYAIILNRVADRFLPRDLKGKLMQVDISSVTAARKVVDRSSGDPAILCEGASHGYRELVDRAGCLAEVLAAVGVTRGGQVACLGLNGLTLLVSYLTTLTVAYSSSTGSKK